MKTWAVVPVLAVGSVSFGRAAAQQSSQPTQDEVPTTTHGKEKKSKKHGKGTAAEIGGGPVLQRAPSTSRRFTRSMPAPPSEAVP